MCNLKNGELSWFLLSYSSTCIVLNYNMQGCSVRGSVKSSGSQTFTHLTNPKNAGQEVLKVRRTLGPSFEFLGPKLYPNMQEKALGGRQTFWFFVYGFKII